MGRGERLSEEDFLPFWERATKQSMGSNMQHEQQSVGASLPPYPSSASRHPKRQQPEAALLSSLLPYQPRNKKWRPLQESGKQNDEEAAACMWNGTACASASSNDRSHDGSMASLSATSMDSIIVSTGRLSITEEECER